MRIARRHYGLGLKTNVIRLIRVTTQEAQRLVHQRYDLEADSPRLGCSHLYRELGLLFSVIPKIFRVISHCVPSKPQVYKAQGYCIVPNGFEDYCKIRGHCSINLRLIWLIVPYCHEDYSGCCSIQPQVVPYECYSIIAQGYFPVRLLFHYSPGVIRLILLVRR